MVIISKKFLMGIVSFLQQAALSLDRVSPQDLIPLEDFYSRRSQHSPRDVITRLECINHRLCPENRFDSERKHWFISDVFDALVTLARICFFQQIIIRDTRLHLSETALRHFEILLADKSKWNREQVNDVRLQMAYTAALLERQIRPRSAREATYVVYHVNHAQELRLKEVEEIAGQDWLAAE